MNKNIIEGKWEQVKGDFQKQYGKLTDSELQQAKGNRKKLSGLIQERYGKAQDAVEKELDEFERKHAA